MNLPPVWIVVRVKKFGFWFPVILLWPLLALAVLLALPFLLIADLVFALQAQRAGFTRLFLASIGLLGHLSGTVVNVRSTRENETVKVVIV
jgi:hypothetical protein